MSRNYVEGKTFKGKNFSETETIAIEYERVKFSNCVFSEADLSQRKFTECEFENCDLSLAKLRETAFREVEFANSKLLGLHFDDCNAFLLSFNFRNCVLNFASFYKLNLKGVLFEDCKLVEAEFVETNLSAAIFKNCDLNRAVFKSAILREADFRTAYNFSIDPELNQVTGAKFSKQNVAGLLDKYDLAIE